jgi:hypothetical protein
VSDSSTSTRFNLAPGPKGERFRAAEIGVHPITLARARGRGELAFVRLGDRVLYSHEHIAEWLERNERRARRAS